MVTGKGEKQYKGALSSLLLCVLTPSLDGINLPTVPCDLLVCKVFREGAFPEAGDRIAFGA